MSRGEIEESVAVEFALSEDEFAAASRILSLAAVRSRRAMWPLLGGLFLMVLLAWIAAAFANPGALPQGMATGALIAGGFLVVLAGVASTPWMRESFARRRFRDPRFVALRSKRRIAATAAGLAFSGPTETLLPWSSLAGFRRVPLGLVIDWAPNAFEIAPRRAFPNDAAFDRFERVLRRYCEGAVGAAPAGAPPHREAAASQAGISFVLTLADLVDFAYVTKRRGFARRHMRFLSFAVVMALLMGFVLVANRRDLTWPDADDALMILALVAFIAALALGLWYADPWLDRQLFRSMARVNADRELGPVQIEIAAEGLVVTRAAGRGQIPWRSLIAVEAGPSAVYLFTTPDQAQIVPRRALASDAAFAAFLEAVRQGRRDAGL